MRRLIIPGQGDRGRRGSWDSGWRGVFIHKEVMIAQADDVSWLQLNVLGDENVIPLYFCSSEGFQ